MLHAIQSLFIYDTLNLIIPWGLLNLLLHNNTEMRTVPEATTFIASYHWWQGQCSKDCKATHTSLVPRPSRERRKKAWYTLFVHAHNLPTSGKIGYFNHFLCNRDIYIHYYNFFNCKYHSPEIMVCSSSRSFSESVSYAFQKLQMSRVECCLYSLLLWWNAKSKHSHQR